MLLVAEVLPYMLQFSELGHSVCEEERPEGIHFFTNLKEN